MSILKSSRYSLCIQPSNYMLHQYMELLQRHSKKYYVNIITSEDICVKLNFYAFVFFLFPFLSFYLPFDVRHSFVLIVTCHFKNRCQKAMS